MWGCGRCGGRGEEIVGVESEGWDGGVVWCSVEGEYEVWSDVMWGKVWCEWVVGVEMGSGVSKGKMWCGGRS